jgi:hypothetical protein
MVATAHCKLLVLLTLLLICLTSATSAASVTATVVLKTGATLENTTFKVDKYYKVIKIEQDGEKRNISFDKIDSIIDADGQYITAEVMGGVYEGSTQETVSENSESYRSATKPR